MAGLEPTIQSGKLRTVALDGRVKPAHGEFDGLNSPAMQVRRIRIPESRIVKSQRPVYAHSHAHPGHQ